jgi:uncharacterized integral membrane protein (TIGR00697 family)
MVITKELRLTILTGLFISFLIAMNVLGAKIIPFGPFSVSVAFLIVPWSFLATDIVTEVYGKKKARELLVAGVISLIVFLAFIILFVALPPAGRYIEGNKAYTEIFGTSARIVLASITAFLLSQFNDVWSFWKIREITNKKYLWLRSNASSVMAMIIDTFAFMFLAFYMLTPKFTFWFVIQMIIPYLIFKMVWGVASTPLVYAGAKWLRGGEGKNKEVRIKN